MIAISINSPIWLFYKRRLLKQTLRAASCEKPPDRSWLEVCSFRKLLLPLFLLLKMYPSKFCRYLQVFSRYIHFHLSTSKLDLTYRSWVTTFSGTIGDIHNLGHCLQSQTASVKTWNSLVRLGDKAVNIEIGGGSGKTEGLGAGVYIFRSRSNTIPPNSLVATIWQPLILFTSSKGALSSKSSSSSVASGSLKVQVIQYVLAGCR